MSGGKNTNLWLKSEDLLRNYEKFYKFFEKTGHHIFYYFPDFTLLRIAS